MIDRFIQRILLLFGSFLVSAGGVWASENFVFITSTTGTADLSTWPDAGGQTGLAAGDAICQAHAAAAALPGTYVAYVSDADDDAFCRIQGLTGRRVNDCGLGAAPAPEDSNPWFRVDGRPVFSDAVEMHFPASERMFYPLWLDENGAQRIGLILTGSNEFGSAQNTCAEFTSDSGGGSVGFSNYASSNWGSGFGVPCSSAAHLACFRVDTQPAEIRPDASGIRQAFAAPARLFGAMQDNAAADGLSGVAGGDRICRNLAAQAGLHDSDSFKAFLSAGSTPAWDRFENPDLPWARIDGVRFADSLTALRDDGALSALNLASDGSILTRDQAWSGTLFDGTVSANTCGDWSDSTVVGATAVANIAGSSWGRTGSGGGLSCDLEIAHMFCLSDSDLMFRDDWDS
ncbi:hypothetical protein HFP89_06250 [Wenzhouxiangella sp. XN79A]|uniref:hypothetical protein n=1 Tax=Wenzhouxiangella sp. XN79A TaxID=2724193 RepID=UPI00144A96CD|nr:hypothetical protein [Wenzhouxiangella sp. XN79A]NKI34763.1 hypothetical protein [Wenzhouxiangella sp. XN79A]